MRPVGIVLAGGLSTRMGGGDKTLLRLAGRTILDHVVSRLAPQVRSLALNANGDPARFREFRLPVVADLIGGNPGPLAGILAGMEWAEKAYPDVADIVTVPGDAPFLPLDLVSRLLDARAASHAGVAIAVSRGCRHPVVGLWPVALASSLRRDIVDGHIRRVTIFIDRHAPAYAHFDSEPVEPFHNVNTAADLAQAERLAGLLSSEAALP